MFGLFKPKVYTVFVSGLFYKADDAEPCSFIEYGVYGKGQRYETAKDFIHSVREMHRKAGYKTKFEIVKF